MRIDHELFRTGIPAIDRQHEAFIELTERVLRLCDQARVERATLAAAVADACRYALEHFEAEEQLMRSVTYPLYRQHLAKHDVFRAEADRLRAELEAGEVGADFTARLAKWLVNWFVAQVQTDDLRLALFLKIPANAQKFASLLQ